MIQYLWKDNKLRFTLLVVSTLLMAIAILSVPTAVGTFTNTLVYETDIDIIPLLFRIIILLVVTLFVVQFRTIAMYQYETNVFKTIETDLAKKLITKQRNLSDVTNIYNQEIGAIINNYLMQFNNILFTMTSFIIGLYLGLSISWQIIVYIMGFTIVSLLINQVFSKKLALLAKQFQDSNVAMNRVVSGIFSVVRTINIFSAKDTSLAKLNHIFENKRIAGVKDQRFSGWVGFMNNFVGYVVQYGLIIGVFILVHYNYINIGQALSLQLLMQYLTSPLFTVMRYKNSIDATKDIRKRLSDILNEPDETVNANVSVHDIILKNVSFSYTEQKFLSEINLSLQHGKRYMIVGQSGSGKSTLLNLILKELQPDAGIMLYGGTDMKELNIPTWYKNIAYVGQKIEILPGTLRENIVMGYPYDEKKFNRIINLLNLEYLSSKLDNALDEDTGNFSGGELQRVAVARMLYKDSPIFIFDEFSSALDNINATQIEKELLKINDKLLINVTHRIHTSLLDSYEKIIIMEDGKIKQFGTPHELADNLQAFIHANDVAS